MPYLTSHITDYLERSLVALYEDDSIYDKFFMDMSPDCNYLLTGAYNKSGHIIDINGEHNVTF
jgi:hypothetical protein